MSPDRSAAASSLLLAAAALALAGLAACGTGSSLPNDSQDTIDAGSVFPDTALPDGAAGGDGGTGGIDDTAGSSGLDDATQPGPDAAGDSGGSDDAGPGDTGTTDATPPDATVPAPDTADDADPTPDAPDDAGGPGEEVYVPQLPPAPGTVVITEIMNDPAQVLSDADGEWIELTNVSADEVDLAACTLHDASSDAFDLGSLGGPLLVAPGEYVVLAVNGDPETNGGITPLAVYSNFFLSNAADEVILTCAGLLVDQVGYGSGWPLAPGASLSLDGLATPDSTTNDAATSWCGGSTMYAVGNLGTPGAANPVCPEIDTEVDSCQLLELAKEAALVGEALEVAALVFDAGLTDQHPWVDTAPGFLAEAGFGPGGVDPTVDPDAWAWSAAEPTPDWDDTATPGFDRWQLPVAAPAAGINDIAFRFSMDAGATWTLCDLTGSEDGYAPADAAHLQTVDDPCGPDTCLTPGAPYCGGDDLQVALTPHGPGGCVLDGLEAVCAYPEDAEDCTLLGGTCADGACVGQAAQPGPGEVLFTEVMQNPSGISDTQGEWFELHNTLDVTVNLAGCVIGSNDADALHTITTGTGALLAPPGAWLLFARSADAAVNGGLVPDYVFTGIALGNGDDLLTLSCDDGLVDVVAWDGGPLWPDPDGASMQLDPAALETPGTIDASDWCEATVEYAPGNKGTPGAANPPCPVPDPCEGVTCDAVPAPACVGNVATTWAAGVCVDGACGYDVQGTDDCDADGLTCVDGECLDVPDPCNPNPCDAAPAATCQADDLLLYPSVGVCTDDDGAAACEYAAEPFPCATYGGTCDAGECVGVATAPTPGQIVFSEMMVDPAAVGDDAGEWVELTNISAVVVDLSGCIVKDQQNDSHVLATTGPFLVAPGGTVLLGGDPTPKVNGGYAPAYSYGGAFNLANDADELELVCDGATIDAVAYDTASWPLAAGVAIQLDPAAFDADANDLASSWCGAWLPYGDGDLGTPGTPNLACPQPNPVDFCRLQGPPSLAVKKGEAATFAARIAEAGLTDLTDGGDAHPWIHVEGGYGPTGSDPVIDDTGWSIWPAALDPDFSAATAAEPGVDQYLLTFPAGAVGTWDVAFRVSVDNGLTWTSCDLDTGVEGEDGSDNGYQASNSAVLDVAASPCDPNPCTTPPVGVCEGDVLTAAAPVGTCQLDAGAAACTYAEVVTDCAALGGACAEGACEGAAQLPAPGQVIVTEIMLDPVTVSDEDGEWIELTNVGATQVVLDGCVLSDIAGGDDHLINPPAPLLVPAGGSVVLGKSLNAAVNGGVSVDYAYGGSFKLANGGDAVLLYCDGELIDGVDTAVGGFVLNPGASIQLDPGSFDTEANNSGAAWCPAYQPYAGGLGTPGAPNPACPTPAPIDWCRLQWPAEVTLPTGASVEVSGRVFEAGMTDTTGMTDPHPLLLAQAAFGPWGSDPTLDTAGWQYVAAGPNAGWTDTAEPGNDEYQATFPAPAAAPDPYALAFRFSADGGLSWTWCDLATGVPGEDGSEDGYQPERAGALLSTTGPCDPNPCTEPPAASCDGDTLNTWQDPGACTGTGGLGTSCEYPPVVVDCALAGGTCEAGACVGVGVPPLEGDAIFTEVMIDPAKVVDTKGEWIELYNTTDHKLDLAGCVVGDADNDAHTIDPGVPLIVDVGDYLLLARNALPADNGGVEPDYVYTGITMANGADELLLTCLGQQIDRVDIDPATFAFDQGVASQLDPGAFDHLANDPGAAWCLAQTPYGAGDLGTPGAANEPCFEPPPDPVPVDWCRLQWPLTISGFQDEAADIYGQLWQAGLTDLTPGVDVNPGVLAQAGFGPADADPSVDAGAWQWTAAQPTPDYDDAATPDNDEYVATIQLPAAAGSPYRYAFRFSVDAGTTWTLCDLDTGVLGEDGSENGFALQDCGQMTVAVDPCASAPCETPPPSTCEGELYIQSSGPGTCTPVFQELGALWEAECSYPETSEDCGALLGTCQPTGCEYPPAQVPAPGELIFTEIMSDPANVGDDTGEWFEVTSVVPDTLLDLGGCVVESSNDAPWVIEGEVLLAGTVPLVFARSLEPALNGGVSADVAWGPTFNLGNKADTLALVCGGATVAAIAWDDVSFPDVTGKALQLDPGAYASDPTNPASWCAAFSPYGEHGNRGTPGATNPACPPATPVQWCTWQWPSSVEGLAGTTVTVFGRIAHAGITDLTPGTDTHDLLLSQAGYGLSGWSPTDAEGNWKFFDAVPNPDWVEDANDPGVDEWMYDLTVPDAPSDGPDAFQYHMAWRVSVDNGLTWTWCGQDGPWDPGSGPLDGPELSVDPDPCEGNPCTDPPQGICTGDVFSGYEATGACTPIAASVFECDYAPATLDCAALGGTCVAGACEGVPPTPTPGTMLFTEFHRDPKLVSDDLGEWVELLNLTDEVLNLQGCRLRDDDTDNHLISAGEALLVEPGAFVVLGKSGDALVNGGYTPDYVYSGFSIANGPDELALECAGILVDHVAYTSGFPGGNGVAAQLDPDLLTPTEGPVLPEINDTGSAWCNATLPFGVGDLGSPGEANPPCAGPQ